MAYVVILFGEIFLSGNYYINLQSSKNKPQMQCQVYEFVLIILYFLLTEFEVHTISYGPSFFPFDLWPKREARGP